MTGDRWSRRNRERKAKRRAQEAAERRHEELKEAWRQRHSDGEDESQERQQISAKEGNSVDG
jgi:hypothetical protein